MNLYNNPGDSSRASYFSKGQTASSTYGATLSDGSTWYRITANDGGTSKTFWLKYESRKMSVIHSTTYTVTFNANGGSVSQSSKAVTSGSTYGSLPTPTRDNYDFTGWYTSASGGSQVTSSTTFSGSSNVTLYAHWTAKTVAAKTITITFDGNGGRTSLSSKQIESGSYLTGLPTATRSGYTFIGWSLDQLDPDASGIYSTTVVSDGVFMFDKDTTLYAFWKATSYTVYFEASGGSVSQNSKSVTPGSAYGTLPTPSRSGYTFDGWYTSANGGSQVTESTTFSSSSDVTLYARWTKDETGDWGKWSDWSTTPVTSSSTRQVETREVKVSDAYTEYRYGRYIDSTKGHVAWCGTYLASKGYSGITVQYSSWSTTRYSTNGKSWTCSYCGGNHIGVDHYDSSGRPCWNEYTLSSGSYFWEESRQVNAVYETQYRYRDWISG